MLLKKNRPDITQQLYKIIQAEFPGNSAETFIQEVTNNPNLRLTIPMIDNEVVCFFGREKKTDNIYYLDWFIANNKLDIKGLGEATLRLAFDEPHEKAATHYAVAKPHVKSFEMVIERFGFVGSGGATLDGEHHHHYARVRRLPTDEEFFTKHISKEREVELLETAKIVCHHETLPDLGSTETQSLKNKSKSHQFIFAGKILKACKVQFPKNYKHHTDIIPNSDEGWFYQELEHQTNQGFVLTRYLKSNETQHDSPEDESTNTYYAIFEKDNADAKMKNDLQKVIDHDIAEKLDYK